MSVFLTLFEDFPGTFLLDPDPYRFFLDPDPYQNSRWIRIRNEFFHILDPDQNDTDPPHWFQLTDNRRDKRIARQNDEPNPAPIQAPPQEHSDTRKRNNVEKNACQGQSLELINFEGAKSGYNESAPVIFYKIFLLILIFFSLKK